MTEIVPQPRRAHPERLTAYAATATAVVASPMAHTAIITGGPATSAIVTTNVVGSTNLLNRAALGGLSCEFGVGVSGTQPGDERFLTAFSVGASFSFRLDGGFAKKFGYGEVIGVGVGVGWNAGARLASSDLSNAGWAGTAGPWQITGAGGSAGQSSGYLGFRFLQGSTTVYGWMQVTWSRSGTQARDVQLTIGQWAYDDTGASIAAGFTGVPGGCGLSALACGAIGLRGRRRDRAREPQAGASREDRC